jgi:alpha-L-arabinofuranosidase
MVELKTNISRTIVLLIFFFISSNGYAQEQINVDFTVIKKSNVNRGVASANLCWIMDSDLNSPNPDKSILEAIKELGRGSLRFPYGHLADNYLWHTPPFNDVEKGLRPKVAAMIQAPGKWDWAVNSDGSFKGAMDFDEYMNLCQKLDIKPLVVVNVFSHKYKNGPSLDELIETAIAWVQYAHKMNYQVEYWQIGNEVDHHQDLLSPEEYLQVYQQIAKAMKSVDFTVKVGPGILSNVNYFKEIISNYPDLIDFTSSHQYMWPYIKSCTNYELWKDHEDNYIPNVKKMQNAVSNSIKPTMEIVITETGVSPDEGMESINNVYKALWYFDVLMNEISQKNVAYSYFWGTHSPWDGNTDNDENDIAVLIRVDDNSRKPIAEVVKLVNDQILDHIVQTKQISGSVRTFASVNESGDKYNVFLMNKNNVEEQVEISINQLPESFEYFSRLALKGENPNDRKLSITNSEKVTIKRDKIPLTLAPLSITVLISNTK